MIVPLAKRPDDSGDKVQELLRLALDRLDDDKAENVTVISLIGKSSIADYMIIASGRSARQVGAMADHLAETLRTAGVKAIGVEGLPQADWVVIDGLDVIIHLFRPEVRRFYNLEKMWGADLPSMAAPQDPGSSAAARIA